MRFAGYDVTTEYYINNVGNQVGKLGESVWCGCASRACATPL